MNRDDTETAELFHPQVWAWFRSRFSAPTEIQRLAWPRIARGEHVLFTAPTGTGKTLAAFLWALNQLVAGVWEPGGVRVLYVSPLKALNNDIRHNLFAPLAGIRAAFESAGAEVPEIRVVTRSGDTPQSERRRMLKKPPEILITTPESLNLLLSSPKARELLTGLRTVILDEIHAVAGSKRGTHLITAVERLVPLSGEFQRLAVSATVRPLERIAHFVGGYRPADAGGGPRPGTTIEASGSKRLALRVEATFSGRGAGRGADRGTDARPVWHRIASELVKLIDAHSSTLVFVNSRRLAEKMAALINDEAGRLIAYAHHGSLSRELRQIVEKRLKAGELSAIVATSSLEMGIDIGDLELVVLVQCPFSVNAAVQRIGRAGHSVELESRGILFPSHGRDLLDAAVLTPLVLDQEVEELEPVRNALDVLAQVIVSMLGVEPWNIDELYEFIRTSAPYHSLNRREFNAVLEMLAGRYEETRVRELKPRISVDRVDGVASARPGALQTVYASGGTIPDRGYFKLRLQGSQALIGELDEEFVWERRVGETFSLGTQRWKITAIDHQKVEVTPWQGTAGAPFWKAETVNRSFHLSSAIGAFLEEWNDCLSRERPTEALVARSSFSDEAAAALSDFLAGQRAHTGTDLPHRRHILIEHSYDPAGRADMPRIFIHTMWGNRVNYPLALALAAVWEPSASPVDISSDNDGVHIGLPPSELTDEPDEAGRFAAPVRELLERVAAGDVVELVRSGLESSGFFGARFRENAARALLLPRASAGRRAPLWLNRLKAKNLMRAVSGYRNFPIMLETWRTCVQDELDLDSLRTVLDGLMSGEIAVSEVATRTPSPFAAGAVWMVTNELMYADDVPGPGSASPAVDGDLLREAVFDAGLRPMLVPSVLEEFRRKLQRVFEGYAPGTSRDLVDWVDERLLIPDAEWDELTAAMDRESSSGLAAILSGASERLARVILPGAERAGVASVESLARILTALSLDPREPAIEPTGGGADGDELRGMTVALMREIGETAASASPERLLLQWLSFSGPVPPSELVRVFGLRPAEVEDALGSLQDEGAVVFDTFRPDSAGPEVCDARNLERLLAIQRRRARPSFEALPATRLPLYLATWQRLTAAELLDGEGPEVLKRSLEQLMGYPARAAAWEEEILPARLPGYRGRMLDELLQGTELEWFGCGRERISFCFADDYALFAPPGGVVAGDAGRPGTADENGESGRPGTADGDGESGRPGTPGDATPAAPDAAGLIPDTAARYTFRDLQQRTGEATRELARRLWEGVWSGTVRCDSYETLRRAVLGGYAPQSPSVPPGSGERLRGGRFGYGFGGRPGPAAARWKVSRPLPGAWYGAPAAEPGDLLQEEELNKERVRFLLKRYGVLFRELLARELAPLRWGALFRAMRIMELGGELLAGHFFKGVSGLQFASHAALRLLRSGLPEDTVYWMNAADPASLCGVGVAELSPVLPERYPSTRLVFRADELVVVARRQGEELEIRVPPGHDCLKRCLACLRPPITRDFHPRTSVKVKSVNGAEVQESGYAPDLEAAGFRRDYQGYTLWAR